jgi:hypothetical protein
MIPRRDALALLGGLVATACAVPRRAVTAAPAEPAFGLGPIVDMVPAAGLIWLVDARPQELLHSAKLGPALAALWPDERATAFARRYGGVDPRAASQVVVAGFAEATLGLARMPVDAALLEAAFASRGQITGRSAEHGIARVRGTVEGEPEQVAIFGQDGAAIERGQPGPLETAIYFAEGKLKRALPALKADPLSATAARLGDAPLRAFAPGPFDGQAASGLGGLLRATTAVGAAVRPVDAKATGAIRVTLVLLGAWGSDAPDAAVRLGSAFHVLSEDPLGRLMGVNRPIEGPRTAGDEGALTLDAVLDPTAMARGLRDATDATVAQIMGK